MHDIANVDPVAQEIGEGALAEWHAASGATLLVKQAAQSRSLRFAVYRMRHAANR